MHGQFCQTALVSLKFEGFFNSCHAVWPGLPDFQHLPKQAAPNFKAIIWDERSALGNSGCQPPEWGGMQFQALLWVWFPPQVQEWIGDLYHCALHIAVGCYLGQCSTGAHGHKGRSGTTLALPKHSLFLQQLIEAPWTYSKPQISKETWESMGHAASPSRKAWLTDGPGDWLMHRKPSAASQGLCSPTEEQNSLVPNSAI